MLKLKILLYKLHKSQILLLLGLFLYGSAILPVYIAADILIITHILLGMYFKRKKLMPYQYGIRIGIITALIGLLIIKIVN